MSLERLEGIDGNPAQRGIRGNFFRTFLGIRPSNVMDATPSTLLKRRVRMPVHFGTARDHAALNCFLGEIFGDGHAAQFHSALEDPFYEPRDRLLLRRRDRVIGHVHLTHRVMQFGAAAIPVAGLQALAIAPHCRHQGLATHLLLAAEKRMAQTGALVGRLRTRIPQFFRRTGWVVCEEHHQVAASPHMWMACLMEQELRPGRAKIQVRPWRRWEEDAIARVYCQNLRGSFGMLQRSRAYWHWLLERRAYDQFHVALDGPNLCDFDETSTRLVGYAAVKHDRVVELITAPDRPKAALELLARVCGDAAEQGHHRLVVDAPPGSMASEHFPRPPVPSLLCPSSRTEVSMVRVLDPPGLLRALGGILSQRAAAAQLQRPLQLGFRVDDCKFQIELLGTGVRPTADYLGRNYLRMSRADFTRLVLGQLDWGNVLSGGRVVSSTSAAGDTAQELFPPLPFRHSLLDDLTL